MSGMSEQDIQEALEILHTKKEAGEDVDWQIKLIKTLEDDSPLIDIGLIPLGTLD